MTIPLVNDNQRRRLATHLQLLSQDLSALVQSPDIARPGDPYDAIRALVARVRGAVDDVRAALELPADRAPTLRQRVVALAEAWAVRVEDLFAQRLGGYGTVDPRLAERLDPRLERLRGLLSDLAHVAERLPDA